MLFIDIKYASIIGQQLDRFCVKKQNPYLANFRCPICGDSQRNKHKCRGYLYIKVGKIRFVCHNCQTSLSLGQFLNQVNPSVYKQYSLERYREGLDLERKPHSSNTTCIMEPPVFNKSIYDDLIDRVDTLPADHKAVVYLRDRQIPEARYRSFYYIDDMNKIVQLKAKYKEDGVDERLLIPYYDENGVLTTLQGRDLWGSKMRYISHKIVDTSTCLFGVNEIDRDRDIFVFEGSFDSTFATNAVAVGTSQLKIALTFGLPKERCVFVFDNQPRNKEICALMNKLVVNGHRLVIWPEYVKEKDLNEMILAGEIEKDAVDQTLNRSTYQGAELQLKFNMWRKCNVQA